MTEIKKSKANQASRRSFLKGTSALAAAGWVGDRDKEKRPVMAKIA